MRFSFQRLDYLTKDNNVFQDMRLSFKRWDYLSKDETIFQNHTLFVFLLSTQLTSPPPADTSVQSALKEASQISNQLS